MLKFLAWLLRNWYMHLQVLHPRVEALYLLAFSGSPATTPFGLDYGYPTYKPHLTMRRDGWDSQATGACIHPHSSVHTKISLAHGQKSRMPLAKANGRKPCGDRQISYSTLPGVVCCHTLSSQRVAPYRRQIFDLAFGHAR